MTAVVHCPEIVQGYTESLKGSRRMANGRYLPKSFPSSPFNEDLLTIAPDPYKQDPSRWISNKLDTRLVTPVVLVIVPLIDYIYSIETEEFC
jgi:hypothetical protein